jgi:hypothetical protein
MSEPERAAQVAEENQGEMKELAGGRESRE